METRESTAYAVIATGGMSDVGAMADAGALVEPRSDATMSALDPATGVRTSHPGPGLPTGKPTTVPARPTPSGRGTPSPSASAPSVTNQSARPLSEVATEAARPLGAALANRPRNRARYRH